tara:strand:+ start:9364 stop:9735 length:372 start_codon:yes stop_codon:yes gene_type:complete
LQNSTQKQNKKVIIDLTKLVLIQNEDEILDFINTLEIEVKESMLKTLDTLNSKDLVVFFTSTSKISPDEEHYIILIKVVSAEEEQNGLILAFSEDVNVISFFLSENSNLTFEEAKGGFFKNEL